MFKMMFDIRPKIDLTYAENLEISLAKAKEFLKSKGITEVKPVFVKKKEEFSWSKWED
jgi:hypothetical protein